MDQQEIEAALAAQGLGDLETLLDDLDFVSFIAKLPDRERTDEQHQRMNRVLSVTKELESLGLYDDVMALWRGRRH